MQHLVSRLQRSPNSALLVWGVGGLIVLLLFLMRTLDVFAAVVSVFLGSMLLFGTNLFCLILLQNYSDKTITDPMEVQRNYNPIRYFEKFLRVYHVFQFLDILSIFEFSSYLISFFTFFVAVLAVHDFAHELGLLSLFSKLAPQSEESNANGWKGYLRIFLRPPQTVDSTRIWKECDDFVKITLARLILNTVDMLFALIAMMYAIVELES